MKLKKKHKKWLGLGLLIIALAWFMQMYMAFMPNNCGTYDDAMERVILQESTTHQTCIMGTTQWCIDDSTKNLGYEGHTYEAYCITVIDQLFSGDCGNYGCHNDCLSDEDCDWLENQQADYGSDQSMRFEQDIECVNGHCKAFWRGETPEPPEPDEPENPIKEFVVHYQFQLLALVAIIGVGLFMWRM